MDERVKRKYRRFFYAILGVFLIVNLATLSDYGMTWDEAAQQHIGQVTIDFLKGKIDGFNFQRDDLKYYGPFFETINYYFASSLLESFKISYVDAFHVLIVLTAALGLLFLFWLASLMFDGQIALIACAFLTLLPRFIAHAHYNSKDIPLTAFFIGNLYFLYSGFTKRKIKHVIFAGIFLGIGLAVRMDLILVLPIFFLAYVIYLIFDKKILSHPKLKCLVGADLLLLSVGLFSALLSVFIAWPALWKSPSLLIDSFLFFIHHGWQGQVFYFNQFYTAAALPWHYAPFFIFATLPIAIVILFIFGLCQIIKDLRQKKNIFVHTLLLGWITVRLIIALLPGAVRYDGMRHFLMILPAVTIIAAIGLIYLLTLIGKWDFKSYRQFIGNSFIGKFFIGKPLIGNIADKIALAVIIIIFLLLTIEFLLVYPFGDSYFNELTRLAVPSHLENKLEIEYWGATYKQGVDWLNNNAAANSSFCVTAASHLLQFYPLRQDLTFSCDPAKTDYLMFFTRKTSLPEEINKIFNYSPDKPIFKVSRFNSDLLYIYKLTPSGS